MDQAGDLAYNRLGIDLLSIRGRTMTLAEHRWIEEIASRLNNVERAIFGMSPDGAPAQIYAVDCGVYTGEGIERVAEEIRRENLERKAQHRPMTWQEYNR
jgi:alkyl hydroperoxide reductase subunit AhpF